MPLNQTNVKNRIISRSFTSASHAIFVVSHLILATQFVIALESDQGVIGLKTDEKW